jgi:hypothetical protein
VRDGLVEHGLAELKSPPQVGRAMLRRGQEEVKREACGALMCLFSTRGWGCCVRGEQ